MVSGLIAMLGNIGFHSVAIGMGYGSEHIFVEIVDSVEYEFL